MVTKQNPIELTIRGIMSNAYWGLRLRAGQSVIERDLIPQPQYFLSKAKWTGGNTGNTEEICTEKH